MFLFKSPHFQLQLQMNGKIFVSIRFSLEWLLPLVELNYTVQVLKDLV